MQKKYFIKPAELFFLVFNLTTYKIFTGYGKIFLENSGPSAPLTALLSGLSVWFIFWVLLSLYDKNKQKTFIELLGDKGKIILFFLLFLYLILSSSATLRLTGELIKAVSFPSAPLSFILLITAAGAVICCSQGFDAISRLHSVVIPISVALSVFVLIFAFPKGSISNITPVLGYGITNTFLKGFSSIGLYGDLVVLFMLSPFICEDVKLKKTALISLGTGIGINFLVLLAFTMLTPYTVSSSVTHPFLQMVKLFSLGRFFERIDGYFLYIISACGILSLGVNIFFISYGAKQAFSLPKIRPLSYSLGILTVFLALIFSSRESAYLITKSTLWIITAVIFTVAAFAIIFSAFKERRKE